MIKVIIDATTGAAADVPYKRVKLPSIAGKIGGPVSNQLGFDLDKLTGNVIGPLAQ